MFECSFKNAELMKKIMDAIKDLIREGIWHGENDSLSLQCMDSSHVSLVKVSLDAIGFEHYRCDTEIHLGGK